MVGPRTSRRSVVRTGVKLAYAAPVVAASMGLGAGGVAAISAGAGQSWILAGGWSSTDPIKVDDKLDVHVNGVFVGSPYYRPLTFRACPFDKLRLVATNLTCCNAELGPVFLHNPATGQVSAALFPLDSGFNGHAIGVFYDQTFTVPSQ